MSTSDFPGSYDDDRLYIDIAGGCDMQSGWLISINKSRNRANYASCVDADRNRIIILQEYAEDIIFNCFGAK